MPYTRNTRIKQTKWKHKQTSEAQVEYRYPFTKITKWVNFSDVAFENTWWFEGISTPTRAYHEALDKLRKKKSTDTFGSLAKTIIDQYHKLLDDVEAVPEVIYTKYPD